MGTFGTVLVRCAGQIGVTMDAQAVAGLAGCPHRGLSAMLILIINNNIN